MSQTWNNETAAIDGAEDGNADINADMNAGAMDDASVELDDSIITANNREGRRLPPLQVNGLDESEILAYAPPMVCDRVHWDTVDEFDASVLVSVLANSDTPIEAYCRTWSDGQHRIWVTEGSGHAARDIIRDWCADNEVEAVNIRVINSVPFRDLDQIPGTLLADLIGEAVDWLFPRVNGIRRRLVADLDLVDDDDVRSMMYLFVSDHMDRYDADRTGRNGTLTLLAFLMGKLRTWPQDLARQAQGRPIVNDRIKIAAAMGAFCTREQRNPSEVELADELGMSVTDLRQRAQTIESLSRMRHYQQLSQYASSDGDDFGTEVVADHDVEADATSHSRNAELTKVIMAAVNDQDTVGKRSQDPLALAAVYLSYWEDMSKAEVARELEILPKTVTAKLNRVLGSAADSLAS